MRNPKKKKSILNIKKSLTFVFQTTQTFKKRNDMEKKCFIIMPANDPDGYPSGHVKRVYDYIISPACRMAGFWPEQVDTENSGKPLEILKDIVESDIALFDLTGKNPKAHYALAIRQALNLPAIMVKDLKTTTPFHIPDLAVIEYDESLRIDTVQKEVEALSEALTKIFAGKAMVNAILDRLGIGASKPAPPAPVAFEIPSPSIETPSIQEESVTQKEKSLPIISPLPGYVGDPVAEPDIEKLKVGDSIFHLNHGRGEIKTIKKMGKDKIAEILFDSGSKTLVIGTSGFFRKVKG